MNKKEYAKKYEQTEKRKKYLKEYREKNREILRQRNKAYDTKHRDRNFNRELLRIYGITLEQRNKMFVEQNGNCGICGENQSNLKRKLSVDHNHETGKVRKLLCYNCNCGLGSFKENIEFMKKAIKYLEHHNG